MSADDESFHPLGQEWEDDLEAMLDDTEYDTDLGMQMAEDAMRVTKGELSEAEFHEQYHEDMMEEFGQDDRPTEQALEEMEANASNALEAFEGDEDMDRREMMKKMGAGAAFLGLGAAATFGDDEPSVDAAAQEDDDDNDGTQWGMVIDLEQCDGCLSCVQACAEENQLDAGVNWMYVLDYEDPEEDLNSGRQRLVRPCQHCSDAPCEKVCPTTARHTRESDGLVLTDYEVCIGCRYCQVACPYGVNYFQWGEPDVAAEAIDDDHVYDERGRPVDSRAPRGVMSKCTMCPSHQDGQQGEEMIGTTACETACPPDAIQFGDMNDSESAPQQYLDNVALTRAKSELAGDNFAPEEGLDYDELEEDDLDDAEEDLLEAVRILDGEDEPAEDDDDDGMTETEAERIIQGEEGSHASTFKLLEDIGTNPNVVYVGNEPGPNAEQTEGPVDYEQMDYERADNGEDQVLADVRKDVTDEGTVDLDYISERMPI
ncbi:4Fe-4S ferredoxin N-terminal domain-containing protein [Halostagnicola bangensis]